jgi:hypothetical protein
VNGRRDKTLQESVIVVVEEKRSSTEDVLVSDLSTK